MIKYKKYKSRAYVLKTVSEDMISRNDFKYPKKGYIECSDWAKTNRCGNGLHGALDGEGDGSLFRWDKKSNWLLLETEKKSVIDLDGKVKFPDCNVLYAGKREIAIKKLRKLVGDKFFIGGQATAGHRGQATAGYRGRATAGDGGQATVGDGGQATVGDGGRATAGYGGRATAGYGGQATAGEGGQATAGHGGQATAGYRGQATAGDRGQATAGYGGQATAGEGGIMIIKGSHGKFKICKETIAVFFWKENIKLKTAIFYGNNLLINVNKFAVVEYGNIVKYE